MSEAVVLHRIDAGRNMARFYRLDVQPDLFGGWGLVREWGRIGRGGQIRLATYASEAEALTALDGLRRLKQRRAYQVAGF